MNTNMDIATEELILATGASREVIESLNSLLVAVEATERQTNALNATHYAKVAVRYYQKGDATRAERNWAIAKLIVSMKQ